jgi:poly[(R)-3-hydroxyalkanoate] polymerase subunit PhaC
MEKKSDDREQRTQSASAATLMDLFGPDVMLRLWTSWLQGPAKLASDPELWWGAQSDEAAGAMLASSVQQLEHALAADPILNSITELWNANPFREIVPINWAEVARALRTVWTQSLAHPGSAMSSATELYGRLFQSLAESWMDANRRWWGLSGVGAHDESAKGVHDKRFAAPDWQSNPMYRALKEIYLLASDWLLKQGAVEGMDEAEQHRLNFHLRQFIDATSPTLLLISNPEALHRVIETGGISLADGARNLLRDLKQGRLSMADATAFAPGKNLAMTPGEVIYRNRLIELIQYKPQTKTVHQIPLLIIPPWINRYYILDMQPRNSMVRYLVEQGFTVFMISWKNIDASVNDITFEDYLDLGPLQASEAICEITGSDAVNVMGYCIGGTLLAMALAYLAVKKDRRFRSATFMVTLLDFTRVGDTAIFMGEETIDFIEQQMMQRGYLDSREMSNMFNLLRSNDLIWANVVNNYLLGKEPPAFDLLYWNSDGTRMARDAHSWYLRNTYVENNLVRPGRIVLKGKALDLGHIVQDIYAVGAEKDHIVPWDAAWRITQLVGGKVRFVLASSGHIAGMINPPDGKGYYWTKGPGGPAAGAEQWRKSAQRHEGSWWSDWSKWLAQRSGPRIPPPPGIAKYRPLQDAPGSYVLER